MSYRVRAVAFPLALLAGACGSPPPTSPPPPPVVACQLLLSEDVEQATGQRLYSMSSLAEDELGKDLTKCTYGTPPGDLVRVVALEVRAFGSLEQARDAQHSARRALKRMTAGDLEDVAGLADGALWAGGQVRQLHVLAGRRRLLVTVQVGDEKWLKERAITLAGRILERLEKVDAGA
ncbi:MAG TPA: hypothetical protein VF017_03260 [Thermoanaerobaculia bacterium]|nr:hypothetical protein [Thermoanaerobaculia bacterium]